MKQPIGDTTDAASDLRDGDRQRWRADLRRQRLAISAEDKAAADRRIVERLREVLDDGATGHLAVYWPLPGEVDLGAWYAEADASGLRLALPVVEARGQPLSFRPWVAGDELARDALGIPCPAAGATVKPDVILAPCVAFDPAGFRLGNGGGYYDRTLAAIDYSPLLVGIAYECLKLATIRPEPHDVPLNLVITEARVYTGQKHAARQADGTRFNNL